MRIARCYLAACAAVVALAAGASADGIDLPVATQGLEQWVGVLARAVSVGARDKAASLEALDSFQSTAMSKLAKHAEALRGLSHGDIQAALLLALSKASSIKAPVFFAQNTDLFQNYISPIQFGFSGVSVSPCAVLISPVGVGFFPEGIDIGVSGVLAAPTGVNIEPQGLNISPSVIVIGPYDTTVAGQGLNIAPAVIVVAPTRTVVNPIGPLAVTNVLVPVMAPALPPSP